MPPSIIVQTPAAPSSPVTYRPYGSAGSIIQYVLTALITIDICVTFFVARFVEGELVTDLRQLAKNYLKLYFWIDLFSVIPFETIGAAIAGYTYGPSDVTSQYINLLKLTYMVRCCLCLSTQQQGGLFFTQCTIVCLLITMKACVCSMFETSVNHENHVCMQ